MCVAAICLLGCVYVCASICPLSISLSRHRTRVPPPRSPGPLYFLLQFAEAGLFEAVWQVKYYNYNKRDHCQWGNSFNSIEYECKPNDTRTLMWVNKEAFV